MVVIERSKAEFSTRDEFVLFDESDRPYTVRVVEVNWVDNPHMYGWYYTLAPVGYRGQPLSSKYVMSESQLLEELDEINR